MSTSPRMKTGVSLEEFLRMPEIDEEAPYLEYIDGRIEAKAMPSQKHYYISRGFVRRFDEFAEPEGLGLSGMEIRHTFAGRSILPDAEFTLAENVLLDSDGTPSDFVPIPPDIHIEVISPDQSVKKTHAKLLHSIAHGCTLGIMVHPIKKTIDVYRPGRPPEQLAADGAIDFAPVLPGLVIPATEVFGWMVVRLRKPGAEPA
jgi:Uma2 family endonuclease